jgi:hypothetical protein
MSLASIQNEIQKLEPAERAALIDVLWESLDEEKLGKLKPNGQRSPRIESMLSSAVNYLP